jgi:hypothetical protein
MAQKSVDTRHSTTERPCKVALESPCVFMLKLESGRRQNYDADEDDDDVPTTATTTTTTDYY